MAANTTPVFVGTPKRPQVRVSAANTNRDGTGTLATVYTAGANGSFFRGLRITPEAAVGAGDVVRIFNQVAGSGNNELIAEFAIPPWNPAASAANAPPLPAAPAIEWLGTAGLGITLGALDVLKASTDQGKTYSVALEFGGDY